MNEIEYANNLMYVNGKTYKNPLAQVNFAEQLDEEDLGKHIKYCAECGQEANAVYKLGEAEDEVWCMKCMNNVKHCTHCGTPKYWDHWHTEWGDYVCSNCEQKEKKLFQERMVAQAKRMTMSNEKIGPVYEGPLILSFQRAVKTYMSELLKIEGTELEQATRYCERNGLGSEVLTTVQFATIITGVHGEQMSARKFIGKVAHMNNVEESIDFVIERQRIQAAKLFKFKKMDHDTTSPTSHYYDMIKSKQLYYIGHGTDDVTDPVPF